MHILHVIPYMHPRGGGPPVVVENFIHQANRRGHQSEILSTPLFCDGDEADLLAKLRELAPTTFVPAPKALILLEGLTTNWLHETVRRADIVHIHTLWSPLNIFVSWACARYRKPYVLMPHGYLDPYSLKVKRWSKAAYLWAVEHRAIAAAQRLIFTADDEMRLVQNLFPSLPECLVIPLGGDPPSAGADELSAAFVERFPMARGRRQLLFLGRLDFKKGIDRILSALPRVVDRYQDVLLTIVGEGGFAFERDLRNIIARRGLTNFVMMTGRLEGRMKWGAYASAEIFLLPSRQENFALTVAEAMHMAVPVIVSDQVNSWPHVEHAGAGMILQEELISAFLPHAIAQMLRDRESWRLASRRGQAYARQHLTWLAAGTKLIECYEEAL